MIKTWEPVAWTGIYVVALVLTWVTLFSFERFAATDVRAWAPFLQAVLSAGAIFAAWALQERKRRADRADLEADTRAALLQHLYSLEWTLGRIVIFCREGTLRPSSLELMVPAFESALEAIRKLNVAHMPNEKAVRRLVVVLHNGVLALAALKRAQKSTGQYLLETTFDVNWGQVYRSRSKVLESLGAKGEASRTFDLPPRSNLDGLQDGSSSESG